MSTTSKPASQPHRSFPLFRSPRGCSYLSLSLSLHVQNSSAADPSVMSAAAVVAAVSSHSSNAQVLAQTKQTFYGISLHENKKRRGFPVIEVKRGGRRNSAARERRGLDVTSKTAGASKNVEVEVEKPLGLTLGQKPGVGVVITAVESGGNAAKAGLKSGDQVIYTSSFFGDELWPADKLGFTKTAIQAKPDSVYFVVSRGAVVDVKRLPKRPAPPRFGRTLTESQKARATHICLDCGFIYTLQTPFDEQPESYVCPQCVAPKKRFAQYDVKRGKAIGGGLPPIGVILGLILGIAGVGALLVYGLQ